VNIITVSQEDRPAQADVAAINAWIVDYNFAQVGDHWKGRLTILARDAGGQLVGGLLGFTDRGWARIEIVVVAEHSRRQGIGTQLLAAAEAEAGKRGCHDAWLDTFSFQALSFYQQRGYSIFGQLESYPDRHVRYFLRKRLAADAGSVIVERDA